MGSSTGLVASVLVAAIVLLMGPVTSRPISPMGRRDLATDKEHHLSQRSQLIAEETQRRIGGQQTLNPPETLLDYYIMKQKRICYVTSCPFLLYPSVTSLAVHSYNTRL
ncbi:hypothetical protein Btru_024482 [Bulinus truncatus]|nr:hypothetical protein Btru_024482 [Bulinus truncatus]